MRHMRDICHLWIACLLLSACGDNGKASSPKDAGTDAGKPGKPSCSVTLKPGKDDQAAIQGALIDAKAGSTVCLAAGRFKLTGQLSLATERVTLRGVADTVLDFSGQTSGANGIELSADHDTLDTLKIENTKGDGVRATEVDYPTLRSVRVEWTAGPSASNGGYGIYPVTSSHVLIEKSYAKGASDTGIYVGQSHDIVVRDNEVEGNVAGIEIENSTDAEVYGNHSHGNTAGILIFNLPGLNVKDGKRANVHDNMIEDNNLENFAEAGNIVHDVPQGTGMFILASDENEVHGNTINKHDSVGLALLSWYVALRDDEGHKDPMFDWYPERNSVHDNKLADNGKTPHGNAALIASIVGITEDADLEWDGIVDTGKLPGGDTDAGVEPGAVLPESVRNCFKANGTATFMNVDLEHNGQSKSSDVTPYECVRPALPAITL
jgi:parallel beta-helix repeat protein